jgi:hypothetical protein
MRDTGRKDLPLYRPKVAFHAIDLSSIPVTYHRLVSTPVKISLMQLSFRFGLGIGDGVFVQFFEVSTELDFWRSRVEGLKEDVI